MTQYIITVFYTDAKVRHFNETDLIVACTKAQALAKQSIVRKTELSVILHIFK